MFFLKSAFCRIYQTAFRIALPVLPYREPEIIDSSAKLGGILQKEKVKSALIVTDQQGKDDAYHAEKAEQEGEGE